MSNKNMNFILFFEFDYRVLKRVAGRICFMKVDSIDLTLTVLND